MRRNGVPPAAASDHDGFEVTSSVRGVAINPGDTQFTRMAGASSSAAVIVRFTTPAFAAEYGASPDNGRCALSDALLTMLPPPASTRRGTTARMQLNVPVKLTPTTSDHSASVYSCIGLFSPMPALLTRSVTPPRASHAAATAASTADESATSHVNA